MKELFFEIKQTAEKLVWNQGVALARNPNISILTEETKNIELNVPEINSDLFRRVVLYQEDIDWECNCGGDFDPCVHVIAACIALKNAKEGRGSLPKAKMKAQFLSYGIDAISKEGIGLARFIEDSHHGTKVNLQGKLPIEKREDLQLSPEDLLIEGLLGFASEKQIVKKPSLKNFFQFIDAGKKKLTYNGLEYSVQFNESCLQLEMQFDSPYIHIKLSPKSGMDVLERGLSLFTKKLPAPCLILSKPLALHGGIEEDLWTGKRIHLHDLVKFDANVLRPLGRRLSYVGCPSRIHSLPKLSFQELSHTGDPFGGSVVPVIAYGSPSVAVFDGKGFFYSDFALVERQRRQEDKIAKILMERFGLDIGLASYLSHKKRDQILSVINQSVGEPLLENKNERAIAVVPKLRVQPSESFDHSFDFQLEMMDRSSGEALSVDVKLMDLALERNEPLVKLMDGKLVELPLEWYRTHGQIIQSLFLAKNNSHALSKVFLPQVQKLASSLDSVQGKCEGADFLSKFKDDFSAWQHSAENVEWPHCSLRPYQKEGIAWLNNLKSIGAGALLADDMGLGKTLQSICVAEGRVLIIAPTTLLQNWERELTRFNPSAHSSIYHGKDRSLPSSSITITSYGVLRNDIEIISKISWDVVICDEAQVFKNRESLVSKALLKIKSGFRIALSGTPIENSLEELWSVLNFLNPGLLGGFSQFRKKVISPIMRGEKDQLDYLRQIVKPFILRRLKSQVAKDLPSKTEQTLWVKLDSSQQAVYDATRMMSLDTVKNHFEGTSKKSKGTDILQTLLRMRQAATDARLLNGTNASENLTHAKIELLLSRVGETLSSSGEGKILVFSQWTSYLDLVENSLIKNRIDCLRIDGKTKNRQEVVDAFQNHKNQRVMLLSLKAAGTGLNLTAADQVYIMDPWWNPAAEQQASDRAYRIGQTRPVFVYRMIAEGTIEEKIQKLKEEKSQLSDDILKGSFEAGKLGKEDIYQLLSL